MTKSEERGMWNLVLFDLPVGTKQQRREATRFRKLLLDLGWTMEQYSVYVRYIPTGMSVIPEVTQIRRGLPSQGKVQILGISDRQWSKAIRFVDESDEDPPEQPDLLTPF